ncbi:hypothetical protein ACOI1H_13720 [Loktanella sp. DJP18]|uniref:hypothetical protein n=1 Tax=Loktanella sp. DJP18 TaxID=3409788 RepID=UPI003BB749D5
MPRNRSLPPHLERRRSGYFWRRRWPRAPFPGSTCTPLEKNLLCFSLRTHVLRDAKILGHRLTTMSDMVFAAPAETMMPIAPHIQSSLLETLVRFEILAFERTRALSGLCSTDTAMLDLRREELLQSTLRQALQLGDRDVARNPLRHVAAQLGIALDETDADWAALAYEATKVLLDVSLERNRRRQGLYAHPTDAFLLATAPVRMVTAAQVPVSMNEGISAASFASVGAAPAVTPAAASFATTATVAAPVQPEAPESRPAEDSSDNEPVAMTDDVPAAATVMYEGMELPILHPFGVKFPGGMTAGQAQLARISMRPPNIHVAVDKLSEEAQRAIAKARGITWPEAIELFFDLKNMGYQNDFSRPQKRDGAAGEKFAKENVSKRRLASGYWHEQLGSGPIEEIDPEAVNDALERLWRLPVHHGKFEPFLPTDGYQDLIERCDEMAASLKMKLQQMKADGATEEEIDRAHKEGHIARLKVDTYLKHARVLGAVGKMLMDMQLIDVNPFALCVWTNKEVKKMRSREEIKARVAWDDRLYDLFRSPIYQEELEDVGNPLFWAPLISVHHGLREEECLQLGPDDFGREDGILYMNVTNSVINSTKTESSQRRVPVHPNLIELGIEQLIALRKKQGKVRLFLSLTRGQWKGTLSENFSKKFNYYRRTNDVYWPGLDFHAFRTKVNNFLMSDNGSDAIRRRIMGHAPLDEGEKSYAQSLRLTPLVDRLVSVVIDISMIRKPFDTASAVVNAQAKGRGLRIVA